jgi:predicted NUDIX family NTP pyrophosphohydrolase
MPKTSAGILFYRIQKNELEVLLVHPGGPFWSKKDEGVWSVPKGEVELNEDLLEAARREVKEELGIEPEGKPIAMNPLKQKGGKLIHCWALRQNLDPAKIISNFFELEWPPKSGLKKQFPEVDRAAWFDIPSARNKILPGQASFLDDLIKIIN